MKRLLASVMALGLGVGFVGCSRPASKATASAFTLPTCGEAGVLDKANDIVRENIASSTKFDVSSLTTKWDMAEVGTLSGDGNSRSCSARLTADISDTVIHQYQTKNPNDPNMSSDVATMRKAFHAEVVVPFTLKKLDNPTAQANYLVQVPFAPLQSYEDRLKVIGAAADAASNGDQQSSGDSQDANPPASEDDQQASGGSQGGGQPVPGDDQQASGATGWTVTTDTDPLNDARRVIATFNARVSDTSSPIYQLQWSCEVKDGSTTIDDPMLKTFDANDLPRLIQGHDSPLNPLVSTVSYGYRIDGGKPQTAEISSDVYDQIGTSNTLPLVDVDTLSRVLSVVPQSTFVIGDLFPNESVVFPFDRLSADQRNALQSACLSSKKSDGRS